MSKAAGSSSPPVAASSPTKSAAASSAESTTNFHTTADVHAPQDTAASSVSSSDVAPATAALDNGLVMCQTTD